MLASHHRRNPVASRVTSEQANFRAHDTLERDDFSSNRHPALASCLSMIFSENRCTLFEIML
jgi:hypothetical protein